MSQYQFNGFFWTFLPHVMVFRHGWSLLRSSTNTTVVNGVKLFCLFFHQTTSKPNCHWDAKPLNAVGFISYHMKEINPFMNVFVIFLSWFNGCFLGNHLCSMKKKVSHNFTELTHCFPLTGNEPRHTVLQHLPCHY